MSTYPDFNTLWDYSNPEKTRAAFERARDELEDATPDVLLQLDTQVARTHGLQRDFDRAHALLDEVASKLTPSTPIARVRYLLERGRVHNSSGDQAASAPLFHDALELAERARAHGYAVDAAHMLGIVSRGEDALAWNRRAITYAEAHPEDPEATKWLGALYNNTGWILHDRGDFQGAMELFERALAMREAAGKETPTLIARWCVARCARSSGQLERARTMQEELRSIYAAREEPSGYVFEELCELALIEEDVTSAAAHAARAHELLSLDPWLVANEPDRLARLEQLSRA